MISKIFIASLVCLCTIAFAETKTSGGQNVLVFITKQGDADPEIALSSSSTDVDYKKYHSNSKTDWKLVLSDSNGKPQKTVYLRFLPKQHLRSSDSSSGKGESSDGIGKPYDASMYVFKNVRSDQSVELYFRGGLKSKVMAPAQKY